MSEKLQFKVSSALKDIVGKDLITDEFIAVFEIVKNSYDAFAKNIIITIEDDKITISDDGKGMSLDDIKNKWLFLAYSAKKDNTEDGAKNESYRDIIQSRRHYAGAKGIGRFSSDRLGAFLTLKTSKRENDQVEIIEINWNKFEENQNDVFQKIDVEYKTISMTQIKFPKNSKHGTVLEITHLNNNWNRQRLLHLKHSLEKLINPFSETNDFNIKIICDKEKYEDHKVDKNGEEKYIDRDKINGEIKNSILEVLNIKTTQISVQIDEKTIDTKIIDRGTLIYHINEENKDFHLLTDFKIDLYYLNRAAKINFTTKMGMQVVNYGSVFFFKNGFRVQPFGKKGDDSWGLDYRSQQGYARFLSSRELFGRVEISSDNALEFKEVSSRDGGMIETNGSNQILNAFKEKGLKRLERYVVGVLWGEGFKKNKYFGNDENAKNIADKHRKDLSEKDSVSDNISAATSNLGSKIDFIQIIKSLASNKDIEIIDFNKDFIDLVNEQLDELEPKFISDLEKIAEQTNDPDLKNKITEAENIYNELIKEKEEAEKKANDEEQKREEAEKKAKKEEEARIKAEEKAKKEEEARIKAELETIKKEKQRAEAEIAKLKAEAKAKDESEKRKKEEEAKIKAENEAARRAEQVTRYKASETVEYKDLRDSNHIIGVHSDDISKKILLLKRKLDRGEEIGRTKLLTFLQGIGLANEKIGTITRFTTKSNFLQASLETKEDIVTYIVDYVNNIYRVLYKIDIDIINKDLSFMKKFQPIELSVVLDNILSNSRKKLASKVIIEFNLIQNKLQINIRDIGKPLSNKIQNGELIFEEGVTTTKGAGLGLNYVKRIIEDDLGGTIIYNSNYTDGFELILTIHED